MAPLPLTIAELPFFERPIRELLHLEVDRDRPSHDFAGFGWARADAVWLEPAGGAARRIDDALVIGLHTADDAEALADDLELELELPDRPVTVLASAFLDRWLPGLPQRSAIVLAICNPHRARLHRPAAATVPVHHPVGDVASWREPAPGASPHDRIILTAEDWWTL
ncbi:MAG TPA: hypothetical protein VGD37_32850 [Kofleriaceae bacterium]